MNQHEKQDARKALYALYGPEPPIQCLAALETELVYQPAATFKDDMRLIHSLQLAASREGYDISLFDNDPSFISWLYGCTEVNPLLPHYYCPICKRARFFTSGDGWDLSVLSCCGRPMQRDGHNLLWETRFHKKKDRSHLHFDILEAFEDTASVIILNQYRNEYDLLPVADDEGTRCARYALIPLQAEKPEVDSDGVWRPQLRELLHSGYRVVDMIFSSTKDRLAAYREETDLLPTTDDLLTEPVLTRTREMLESVIAANDLPLLRSGKLTFSELLRMEGYLRNAYIEDDNPILLKEHSTYSDLFTSREDVRELLLQTRPEEHGISMDFVELVTLHTRTGLFTNDRMSPETERILRELGISEHWITQMKLTCFLASKNTLIPRLLDRMKLAWYELQE